MKTKHFLLLLIGLMSQFQYAQTFDKDKLDKYFDILETNNKFMGSIAVSKNAELIYSRTIGFVDVENNIKANESSIYRIGSISKTFTAVLVLKAVEQKKLSLDDKLSKFYPNIINANNISIRHLLYHRSGIASFTDQSDYLTWNTVAKTEEEMLTIITQAGSKFEPDSKAAYSNSNYVLLSFILEKVFKANFAQIIQKQISQPLGLKNTSVGKEIDVKNNECKSYIFNNGWKMEPETDMSIPLGAGAIVSTPSDLLKFGDALFGGKLINAESLAAMSTIKDNYGMGLFQFPFGNKRLLGHTGGIDGFVSIFSHFADEKITYAMTSNASNYSTNNISIAVLSAIFGQDYTLPVFNNSIVLTADELEQFVGVYISTQLPIKIVVTRTHNALIAQATGQPAFELEATDINKFKFDKAGAAFEFDATKGTMILKQGGGEFEFKKEKE